MCLVRVRFGCGRIGCGRLVVGFAAVAAAVGSVTGAVVGVCGIGRPWDRSSLLCHGGCGGLRAMVIPLFLGKVVAGLPDCCPVVSFDRGVPAPTDCCFRGWMPVTCAGMFAATVARCGQGMYPH